MLEAAERYPELTVVGGPVVDENHCHIVITLDTTGLARSPRGLRLLEHETFLISVPRSSHRPPHVTVDHDRFLGFPHVMSGHELCLYLDPAREWDAGEGIGALLSRLWDWLSDAAGNKFDSGTALYHAVGGTLHVNENSPTFVVRTLPRLGGRPTTAFLHRRTPHRGGSPAVRFDLELQRVHADDIHVPVVPLRRDLPIGAGQHHLKALLIHLQRTQALQPAHRHRRAHLALPALVRPPHPHDPYTSAKNLVTAGPKMLAPPGTWLAETRDAVPPAAEPEEPALRLIRAIVEAATHNRAGTEQHVIVAVPHPAGGPHHLIGFSIPAQIADALRDAVAEHGPDLDPMQVAYESALVPMRWARISDERGAVTTRRDIGRPVAVLEGKTVHVWGVGGLGSWIAEFVVRAGARHVVLCDPGTVTGGLLVRQNFTDDDIGVDKATALAGRLRQLSADVIVDVEDFNDDWMQQLLEADLVIDATISRTVTGLLDELTLLDTRRAVFAQVATDVATGTLGIAIVTCPGSGHTLTNLDKNAHEQVRRDPELEGYSSFWSDPSPGAELVPTRGCSIPTFHGSAADLAGVASSLLNLTCLHLDSKTSGVELFALPHTAVTPTRRLIEPALRLSSVA